MQTIHVTLDGDLQPLQLLPDRDERLYWQRVDDLSDGLAYLNRTAPSAEPEEPQDDEALAALEAEREAEAEALIGTYVRYDHPYPAAAWGVWGGDDNARHRVQVIDVEDAPPGQFLESVALGVEDGLVTATPTFAPIPLADRKAALIVQAQALYDAKLAAGFPVTHGAISDTLQLRDNRDRTNWLGLKDSCNDAILAGLGEAPCPLPVRTTGNQSLPLTFNETAQMMRDLRTWAAELQGVVWAKKDAIDAAADAEALAAVEATLEDGWPS